MNSDLLGIFVVGLLGAGHCFAMCGGIATAITIGQNEDGSSLGKRWLYLLSYNLGRLFSYMCAGAITGGALSSLVSISGLTSPLLLFRLFAAVMMIFLALYIGQWWKGLVYIEKIGQYLWRYLSPLASSLLPLKSPATAFPFGMLWGWLPCGLVYSALSWAAVSGSAIAGMQTMLFFGLGTLPAMLLVGASANAFKQVASNLYVKKAASLLLLGYGFHVMYATITLLS